MSEVALRREQPNGAVVPLVPTTAAVLTLADWAQELDAAYAMAQRLVATPFVPRHFQGKPADAAAAILTGHELGFSPMAALRSIFLIGGTPGMYAKAMVAVVQAQGHEVWIPEQSAERVVVRGRRKGSEHTFETVWDRARVVAAKLTSNAKYQETPQQMMVARGLAEICRQVAADALHGIPYSVEELEDMPPVRVEATIAPRVTAAEILGQPDKPAEPEPPGRDWQAEMRAATTVEGLRALWKEAYAADALNDETVKVFWARKAELDQAAKQGPAAEGWPEVAQPATADENPIADLPLSKPTGRPITDAQQKKLLVLAKEIGLENRDARMDYINAVIDPDRHVDSSKDLTSREASAVIDEMSKAKANEEARAQRAVHEVAKEQSATLRSTRSSQAAAPDEAGY